MIEIRSSRIGGRIIAGFIILFIGLLFLLGNIYPEFDAGRFLGRLWPLILIIIGFVIIFNRTRVNRHLSFGDGDMANAHIMGDVKLDFVSKDVGDAKISQILGDLTIDLTKGRLKSGINRVNASMIIGSTLILIPSEMPLRISARTILGDISFDGHHEGGVLPRLEHVDETYESSQSKLFITLSGVIGDMTLKRI